METQSFGAFRFFSEALGTVTTSSNLFDFAMSILPSNIRLLLLLCRYSYDQTLVHTIVLSSEHNMTVGSRQYDWLEEDLVAVNRSITPWVVVEMHRPLYSTRTTA